MPQLKIGILREGKIPPDRRVALTPQQCLDLQKRYPDLSIRIQPSDIRSFTNAEYVKKGLEMSEDLSDCSILFGVKEVPIHLLLPDKTYFFFSHTLKKQPYNQKLLQAILERKIRLIDYEVITDGQGKRLIAFGRFAGLIGTYNALLLFGKRSKRYKLRPAHKCRDLKDLENELRKVNLPPIKIVATGKGRVGNGITQILEQLAIREVDPREFVTGNFSEPVFTFLSSADYNRRKTDGRFERAEFHQDPGKYESAFSPFSKTADMLIAGAYWDSRAPRLFSKGEMREPDFKIRIIADITCDINGSIPSTMKPCTIYDPAYDYNPFTESIEPVFSSEKNITVMAIDNLPGEMPRAASKDFGEQLMIQLFPIFATGQDPEGILARARMTTEDGRLTEKFSYLEEYANGL